jgi:hypothetical protein
MKVLLEVDHRPHAGNAMTPWRRQEGGKRNT